MKKLGKCELIMWLRYWAKYKHRKLEGNEKEAYNQIREIIKQHFERTVTSKEIKSLSLDLATKVFYDSWDHEKVIVPLGEYPRVEKAIIKFLKSKKNIIVED